MGSGAATIATIRLLLAAGAKPGNLRVCDSKGLLGPWRKDVEAVKDEYEDKYRLTQISNSEGIRGGVAEAMKGADVVFALSKPEPGTIQKDWVSSMAKESIVFAMANPIPEIWPWDAKDAGARIVATGRSDFPNQVNNSTGFPGIFRGTLDVRAKTITDEMCIAAAMELAKVAQDRGLKDDYITPTMDDWEIFPREAVAVAMKAQEQGVARLKVSRDELYKNAMAIIKHSRDEVQMLMKEGLIRPVHRVAAQAARTTASVDGRGARAGSSAASRLVAPALLWPFMIMHKSGFVAIVGKPNVGKSTLVNALVGEKVAIVSAKPQTTRNRILGISTTPDAQIVFIDTPGVHQPRHQLGQAMMDVARQSVPEADVAILLVDVSKPPHRRGPRGRATLVTRGKGAPPAGGQQGRPARQGQGGRGLRALPRPGRVRRLPADLGPAAREPGPAAGGHPGAPAGGSALLRRGRLSPTARPRRSPPS